MKILLITQDFPPPYGGIAVLTLNLFIGLKEFGHNVRLINVDSRNTNNYFKLSIRDFFYTPATSNSYFKLSKILNPRSIFNQDGGFRDFVYHNMIYRVSRSVIDKFKPDVIHITHARLYSAVYGSNVPFFVTCHAEELYENYLIHSCLTKAARIFCVSKYCKKLVDNITKHSNSIVVHNSVKTSRFLKEYTKRENQILTISRLEPIKNVATLIRAYSLLPINIMNEYKYLIIGDGSEKNNLNKLIKTLHMENRIKIISNVSEDQKLSLLNDSKLFMLCPLNSNVTQEGFGIVFLEAQSSGVPIIASNVGGVTESVGSSGVFVKDPNDPSEISSLIVSIISNNSLNSSLRMSASSRVTKFEFHSWISRIISEYQKTII